MTEFTAPNIVLKDTNSCLGCYLNRLKPTMDWFMCVSINATLDHDFKRLSTCPLTPLQPVKRCGDCTHIVFYDDPEEPYCPILDNFTTPDWYCADFKAKEKQG